MCVFCNDEINQDLITKESDAIRVLADYFPMGRASLIIAPKRHVASITDLSANEQFDLICMIDFCTRRIKDRIKPNGVTILINEGEVAGQRVPHLYVHVIARNYEDGLKNIRRTKQKFPISQKQLAEIEALFLK